MTHAPALKARRLLVTTTGEMFQPVRLYYEVRDHALVRGALAKLRCVVEDRRGGTREWRYEDEARSLRFGPCGYDEVPAGVKPVIIGRFRFPKPKRVVLEVRSATRAVEAAKFFAPVFGEGGTLRRARVINRFFDADEAAAGLDALDAHLDRDVTVINPSGTDDRPSGRPDVPLVEDFPLWPEEETPEFRDLRMTLELRSMRAWEHWQGNRDVTLKVVIERLVAGMYAQPPAGPPRR